MLFPSVVFLAYFAPVFLCAYFFLPWKNLTFFLFSLAFFYWGETKYTGILLAYVAINYIFGLLVGRCRQTRHKKWALALGVAANCGILAYYKYFTFLLQAVLPDVFGIHVEDFHHPHLPLGISYFTFHGISYLIDVYRGVATCSASPLNVGLYIAMFPHMVAGPIVRYHTIAKALLRRCFTVRRIAFGLKLFAIGMAQKMLIANNVAGVADTVFALPTAALDAPLAWLGVLAYSLQIYFDFCGYSFMAIALGIILGFRLPRNFRYPYFSQSITEFWRRWHISLSTWFRDYLYIPLGGNRKGQCRTLFNLMLVFFLCGLWHGAAYTFIAWGMFHGMMLVLERVGLRHILLRLPRIMRHGYTVLAVMLGWVLFRADTIGQAQDIYLAMWGWGTATEAKTIFEVVRHEHFAALGVGILFATPLVEWFGKIVGSNVRRSIGVSPYRLVVTPVQILWPGLLFVLSYAYILAGSYSPFLYFRF